MNVAFEMGNADAEESTEVIISTEGLQLLYWVIKAAGVIPHTDT